MKITQISVFLENRKGRLYDACSILGQNGVNIRALNIAETDKFGVLRMVVDSPDKALSVLKTNGFVATTTEIVAVEVEDRPGGLAEILGVFNNNEINIEYMYGFVEKRIDKALLVFRVESPDSAITALTKAGIKIVGKADIQGL